MKQAVVVTFACTRLVIQISALYVVSFAQHSHVSMLHSKQQGLLSNIRHCIGIGLKELLVKMFLPDYETIGKVKVIPLQARCGPEGG